MKVEGWVMTNRVGSKTTFEVTISEEDLEGLTDSERQSAVDEIVFEYLTQNAIEWGWKPK